MKSLNVIVLDIKGSMALPHEPSSRSIEWLTTRIAWCAGPMSCTKI